jgi:hypothetical protein
MKKVRVLSREHSATYTRGREVTLVQVRAQMEKAIKSAETLRNYVDNRPARLFRDPKKAA